MAYVHRIDNVIFTHGGITHAFVRDHLPDTDYEDTDSVIEGINRLGRNEMWDDESPIWFRPQFIHEKMYWERDILQVVGHTPVEEADRHGNVVSCDLLFSIFLYPTAFPEKMILFHGARFLIDHGSLFNT